MIKDRIEKFEYFTIPAGTKVRVCTVVQDGSRDGKDVELEMVLGKDLIACADSTVTLFNLRF